MSSENQAQSGIFDQICMYACPVTDFNPNPFEYKYEPLNIKSMTIQEYKKKFTELFVQMESEHGCCESVNILHTNQHDVDVNGVMTDIKCTIEY